MIVPYLYAPRLLFSLKRAVEILACNDGTDLNPFISASLKSVGLPGGEHSRDDIRI